MTHTEGALVDALRELRRIETDPAARVAYLDWEELRCVADLEDADLPAYIDGHPRAAYLAHARAAIRAYRGAKRAR